jgi:hypothetical protein
MDLAALMGRVQRLLFSPATEWDAIASEPADIRKTCMDYVGPLIIAAAVAAALGQLFIGVNVGFTTIRMPLGTVLTFLVLQIFLGLIGVYVTAWVINTLAPQFEATADMDQAFKLSAFFPTAIWVAGLLTILPQLSALVWLGIFYSFYLLYLGIPKLMKPAPDKATTYTIAIVIVSIVIFIVMGSLARTIAFSSGMPMGMPPPA